MDTNIYYIPKFKGISITSNYTEIQRRMDVGIDPKIDYIPISASDIDQYDIKGIGFNKVENNYFQDVKGIFSKYKFESVAFNHSSADLTGVILDVNHLLLGDNSKVNLSGDNFQALEEITFLSVKTFKGKILDKIKSVKKLTLWYESKKANSIISMFPNLKELIINNATIEELDLTENPLLAKLQLHNCTKLERVVLNAEHHFEKVFVEHCKKLDISNLGNNVVKVG